MSSLAQNCASYAPDVDPSDLGEMSKQMFSNSAALTQGCDLSSYYAALAGKMSVAGGLASSSFAGQVSGLQKSGCQAFAASVGNFLNACYQAKCVVDNDSSSQTIAVTGLQNVNVIVSGGSTAYNTNCPTGVNITQTEQLNAKIISYISESAATAISNIVKQAQATTAQQLQQIKDGYQGTSSGATAIQGIQQKVTNQDQATNLNNTITSLNNNLQAKQNINYEALSGSTAINIFPCTVNQNTLMLVQIASILSTAYSDDFKSAISEFSTSKYGQVQSIISKGAPNVVGQLFKNNLGYIIGIVISVILAFFVLKFLKSKQGQELVSKGIASAKGGAGGLSKGGAGGLPKSVSGMGQLSELAAFRRYKLY